MGFYLELIAQLRSLIGLTFVYKETEKRGREREINNEISREKLINFNVHRKSNVTRFVAICVARYVAVSL